LTDDDTLDESAEDNPNIRQLREQAKEAKEARKAAEQAQAELAALQRENAFRKVGIDPDDPKTKYFAKAYDGELTAEAIKAEAEAAGFLAQPADPTGADEQAAWQRTASAAAGASAEDQQPDPLAQLRAAKSPEEITAIMERLIPGVVHYGDEGAENDSMVPFVKR